MYKGLEIDHIFKIVSNDEEALKEVRGISGDNSAPPFKNHSGQGTSARFAVFDENYLEFIYLENRQEAQENILRFDQRVDKLIAGEGNPFGFGLRGVLTDEEKKNFTLYTPGYNKPNHFTFVLTQCLTDLSLPLIFFLEIPGRSREDWFPKNYKPNLKLIQNQSLRSFRTAELTGSRIPAKPFGNLSFIEGQSNKLTINGLFHLF